MAEKVNVILNDTEKVLFDLGEMFLDSETSDLIIIVGQEQFPVHRAILAKRSEYFRALLFSGLKESSEKEIKLTGTTAEVFLIILKYFYTGKLEIGINIQLNTALKLLTTCHEWLLSEIYDGFFAYLKKNLNLDNNLIIFQVAASLNLPELQEDCLKFWDKNAGDLLEHPTFLKLDTATLCSVIKRDTFCCKNEELIFEAVIRWSEANEVSKDDLNLLVLELIRFPLMDEKYLLKNVVDSGIMDCSKILKIFLAQRMADEVDLNYRAIYVPNQNMLDPLIFKGVTIIAQKSENSQNNDDVDNSGCCQDYPGFGYNYNTNSITYKKDIIITLENPSFLNYIEYDSVNYGYIFDAFDLSVSVDGKIWNKLEVNENYFPKRIVRFIKYTGVNFYQNQKPYINHFQAFMKEENQDQESHKTNPNSPLTKLNKKAFKPKAAVFRGKRINR